MGLVVLIAAAAIAAGPPPGFAETPSLEPAASYVAGKAVHVYCAGTPYDWTTFLAATGRAGQTANGSAVVGSDELKLSPVVCSSLKAQLHFGDAYVPSVAPSVIALVHEAIHDRGERDEGVTDCAAVHEMPRAAVKFFRVKAGKQLRALMAEAWKYRDRESPAYRSVC